MQSHEQLHAQFPQNPQPECPVNHGSMAENVEPGAVAEQECPAYFIGSWQKVDRSSSEMVWVFSRKTNQDTRKIEVKLGELYCTQRFKIELQVWAELALSYLQNGPSQLQLLVDELVLFQRTQPGLEKFDSLADVGTRLFEGKHPCPLTIEFSEHSMKFRFLMKYMGLPTNFFELLKYTGGFSDEEQQHFLGNFIKFYKKTHTSIHALAQSVVKQLAKENRYIYEQTFLHQSSDHLLVVGNESYTLDYVYDQILQSEAVHIIDQYFVSLVLLIAEMVAHKDITQAEKMEIQQKIVSTMNNELHSGITFLSKPELRFGLELTSMQELRAIRVKETQKDDDTVPLAYTGLKVINSKHQSTEFFTKPPHFSTQVYLPRSHRFLHFHDRIGSCPHPYMVPIEIYQE